MLPLFSLLRKIEKDSFIQSLSLEAFSTRVPWTWMLDQNFFPESTAASRQPKTEPQGLEEWQVSCHCKFQQSFPLFSYVSCLKLPLDNLNLGYTLEPIAWRPNMRCCLSSSAKARSRRRFQQPWDQKDSRETVELLVIAYSESKHLAHCPTLVGDLTSAPRWTLDRVWNSIKPSLMTVD